MCEHTNERCSPQALEGPAKMMSQTHRHITISEERTEVKSRPVDAVGACRADDAVQVRAENEIRVLSALLFASTLALLWRHHLPCAAL